MHEHPTDLMTPWCVHTVATLRIAEHVEAGKTTPSELVATGRQAGGRFYVELRRS
jgi:Zn-dependent oligopeptidase